MFSPHSFHPCMRAFSQYKWLVLIIWYLCVSSFVISLQARLFDEPQLASLCLDTIDKSTADAINAEGFTDIDLGMWVFFFLFLRRVWMWNDKYSVCWCADTLCAVLQRDTLSIRENRLFGAVVRWAEAECYRQQLPPTSENKQKVLGKALPLIRFPLMTVEEFAAGKRITEDINCFSCCRGSFFFFFPTLCWPVQLLLNVMYMRLLPDMSIQLKPQTPVWYSFLCKQGLPSLEYCSIGRW